MTTASIRDLDFAEIEAMLQSHRYGRLAFTFRDRVDIEPIHYGPRECEDDASQRFAQMELT